MLKINLPSVLLWRQRKDQETPTVPFMRMESKFLFPELSDSLAYFNVWFLMSLSLVLNFPYSWGWPSTPEAPIPTPMVWDHVPLRTCIDWPFLPFLIWVIWAKKLKNIFSMKFKKFYIYVYVCTYVGAWGGLERFSGDGAGGWEQPEWMLGTKLHSLHGWAISEENFSQVKFSCLCLFSVRNIMPIPFIKTFSECDLAIVSS